MERRGSTVRDHKATSPRLRSQAHKNATKILTAIPSTDLPHNVVVVVVAVVVVVEAWRLELTQRSS